MKTLTLRLDDETADKLIEALREATELMGPMCEDDPDTDEEDTLAYRQWAMLLALVRSAVAKTDSVDKATIKEDDWIEGR